MKKEEILKVVRSNEGTVLSFPDRGPWGNNRYRYLIYQIWGIQIHIIPLII